MSKDTNAPALRWFALLAPAEDPSTPPKELSELARDPDPEVRSRPGIRARPGRPSAGWRRTGAWEYRRQRR